MVFKVFNNTTSLNGLVPTLLVFGVYPQMAELDILLPTVTQCANAVKKAIVEICKLYMEWQVTDILNVRNRPKIDTVYNLPPNLLVLVWREGNIGYLGYWNGPFTLLTVKGEIYIIKLISRPTPFYFIVIKLYL